MAEIDDYLLKKHPESLTDREWLVLKLRQYEKRLGEAELLLRLAQPRLGYNRVAEEVTAYFERYR